MPPLYSTLIAIALGAVVVVLGLGLWTMLRGKSASRSQTLMRWRVILQAVAIVVILGAVYLARG